ncbi:MAG TPA: bifunctional 2',3'-cyclic-nucleotide 2'-phosphodiesterase/3'-nucleotidase [Ureibacillus sp.]|nr:bifunctional 2',3'-cyclic-nucleotide 2'-phosphodiesterase/3'-nucleotidase [Ureibacillus sp.]
MWKKVSASALALSIAVTGFTNVNEADAAKVDQVTRGEYVKAVIDSMGIELGSGKTVKFNDVPASLKPYVEKAIELKLIDGKTAKRFAPNAKVTREEAVVGLANVIQDGKSYSEDILKNYKDINSANKENLDEIAKAISLGFLSGYTDKTLKLKNVLSTNHLDLILKKFLKEYKTTISLQILGTSDIHTNIMNYDYYKDTESNSLGLVKVASLINQARKENSNTLLFDNGDAIQGTPLGSYKQAIDVLEEGEEHPSVAAMEYLDYDAATFGNHEFNYGLDYLEEVKDDADFPYVNANIRNATTGNYMYTPYVLIEKDVVDSKGNKTTIKVGVTGIVPPQILNWDKSNLEGKVTVDDSVQSVEKVIPQMQKEGADVIVVLSHSGIGDATYTVGEEDVSYLLTKVKGVDAVISGHAHGVFPGAVDASLTNVDLEKGTMNGVPIIMPGKYGSHLGVIDLTLEKKGEEWDVVEGTGKVREIAKDSSDVDKGLTEVVKEAHEGTIKYVRQAVGKTSADIHSYFSQVLDDPSIQIVTDAQAIYVKEKIKGTEFENLPVLSAGAPFKAGTRSDPEYYTYVPAGELAIKNVADLYLYDNTLAIIKVTGADVKEWLEMSAGQFNQIDPNSSKEQQLINTEYRSYNYDVIDGVTYEIDVTQPAKYDASGNLVNAGAERIVNLQFNGKPIDPKQEFIVATNNYRANGTFPGVRDKSYVYIYPDENRQAIIDYITANDIIDPSADNNWKFANFPTNANVVFETSKNANTLIPNGSNIQYLGEGTDGFGKYSIK